MKTTPPKRLKVEPFPANAGLATKPRPPSARLTFGWVVDKSDRGVSARHVDPVIFHFWVNMTPSDISEARQKLGLTLEAMATMLGYEGEQARSQVHHLETGRREIRPAQRRLIEAYLSGYRPADWPHQE